MERTIWLTEERIVASVTGAPATGNVGGIKPSLSAIRTSKQVGFVPPAYGPGLVCEAVAASFHTDDHAGMGHTAWNGRPLGSRGAGYG